MIFIPLSDCVVKLTLKLATKPNVWVDFVKGATCINSNIKYTVCQADSSCSAHTVFPIEPAGNLQVKRLFLSKKINLKLAAASSIHQSFCFGKVCTNLFLFCKTVQIFVSSNYILVAPYSKNVCRNV